MKGNRTPVWNGGWRAALGCNLKALAMFRMTLGFLLTLELLLRYRFLHAFYSDEGTLPTRLLIPKVDIVYQTICIHLLSGSMIYQQALLTIQVICAASLLVGYKTRIMACLSWYLYLSLTLRNTWLNFILDRYFHYMLFYSMFLPISNVWSVDSMIMEKHGNGTVENKKGDRAKAGSNETIVTIATIAIKAQIFWIYLDAGQGKYNDPLKGWTWYADPLPALDTYSRHTLAARYLYALVTPVGLRLMTPTVVWAELLAVPTALFGSYFGNRNVVLNAIGLICSLHIGIAFTVRNCVLLSSVACAAWCVFLPPTLNDLSSQESSSGDTSIGDSPQRIIHKSSGIEKKHLIVSSLFIIPMVLGSMWFEILSGQCNQSMKHIYSTLLHNRWNVFIGAEEYVTWEIAPGRLADGSIVDVWGRKNTIDWAMPGTGAPSTSSSRPGRWRSFPYLAGLEGEDGEALWGYLCKQWDDENSILDGQNPGRKLLRFNFFMLQADVLPNMGFSATRKRLIHSRDCTKTSEREGVPILDGGVSEL